MKRSMFLLGLSGEGGAAPAGEEREREGEAKSDPKSSDFNNLEYASLLPSFTGDGLSTSPNVCSLEEDLHGMNRSLQAEFDFEGDVRLEMERREEGELRVEMEDAAAVSSRSEVPDIPAGRFKPDFFASIFSYYYRGERDKRNKYVFCATEEEE